MIQVTAEIIDGKMLSNELKTNMKDEVISLKKSGIIPHLTVILLGDNPASRSYVKGKEKACAETGISSYLIELKEDITEEKLLKEIEKLNHDTSVHGILVQLLLPDHIEEQKIITIISPQKDVDGIHPMNIGRMMTGKDTFLPCTPHGINTMLKSKNISIEGKHAVVLGRSNIVGKPVGQLLLNENATVTYCNSRTNSLRH